MKLVLFELKKLLPCRTALILFLAFVLNLAVYYVCLIPYIPSDTARQIRSEWQPVLDECGGDTEACLAVLSDGMARLSLLNTYLLNKDFLSQEDIETVEKSFGGTMYMNKETAQTASAVLYELSAQYQAVIDYQSFIGGLNDRAENMLNFSIFARENSFSKRNIEKTVQDFSRVSDIDLTPSDGTGIACLQKFYLTDIFMLLLVCLLSFQMFGNDAATGMAGLTRAAPGGGLLLRSAQLMANSLIVAAISIVFYLSNIILSAVFIGIDPSAAIQSLTDFRNVPYPWTTGTYLVLFLVGKMCAVLFISLLCQFLSVLFKGEKLSWFLFGAVIAVSFLLWFFIPDHPTAKLFRYLNPVGLLDMGQLLGNYQNLDIFSYPVTLLWAAVAFAAVLGTLFIVMSLLLPGINLSLPRPRLLPRKFHCRPSLPFFYELRKILFNQKVWGIVLLLAVWSAASFKTEEEYIGQSDFYYIQSLKQWQGGYTASLSGDIKEAMDTAALASSEELLALQTIYEQAAGLDSLAQSHPELTGSLGLVSTYTLDLFFQDKNTEIINGLLVIIALILSLCMLYGQEQKSHMNELQKSTPLKACVYRSKTAAAAVLGCLYTILVYIPDVFRYFFQNGLAFSDYALQSYPLFENVPYHISIFGGMLLTLLLRCTAGILLGLFIALIAQIFTTPAQNIIVSGILFILPLCLSYISGLSYENALVLFIRNQLKGILKFSDMITSPQGTFMSLPLPECIAVLLLTTAALVTGGLLWSGPRTSRMQAR